jgi:xylitol oxidase
MTGQLTNWAGNVAFGASSLHQPTSVPELQLLVARSGRIRALGTGHSFNDIADSPGDLVSLARLPPIMQLDAERSSVTVAAGLRYGELAVWLHSLGYALANLASLPHIGISGACATGTHGSGNGLGNGLGNLATSVSALEMVTASGEIVALSRDGNADHFAGAVVALGALGVVTTLTLDVVPAFDLRQYVFEHLPHHQLVTHMDEIFDSGYSVSVFTNWKDEAASQIWVNRRTDARDGWKAPRQWLGAIAADGPRHPVPGLAPERCTQQMGIPGRWYDRLPHFRSGFTPSTGNELQSEYLLPRADAAEALAALEAVGGRIAPVLQISEIRTVASDELWLSPSYQRDTLAVHFTWVRDMAAVMPVMSLVEEQLAPFAARPHWAKLFTICDLHDLYPRLADFQRLVQRYDGAGKFRNEFIERYF